VEREKTGLRMGFGLPLCPIIGVRGEILGLEYVPHYPLSLRHGGEGRVRGRKAIRVLNPVFPRNSAGSIFLSARQ